MQKKGDSCSQFRGRKSPFHRFLSMMELQLSIGSVYRLGYGVGQGR